MGKRMHILFWPGWWYPNRTDPLGGIFIKKHAEAVSRFCDVSILYITPDPKLKEKKYDLNYSIENNLRTLRFYYRPGWRLPLISKLCEFINYVIAGSRGLRFLKETTGSPDVIHVNVNPPAGLIFLLFTRLRKIPYIFTEHWSGYLPANGSYKGLIRKWLTRLLVKRAGAVTTVSENLKNAMLAHKLEGNYHIVPNVVDTDLFHLPTENENRPGKKKRILHVSGLVPVKNIPGILRVVKRLADKRNDFELYIVGEGEHREGFEHLALELGILNKVVFFQGEKRVEEVAVSMRESDFLLLFSDYENSPCVIVEAMASGLPVLASNVGGIPELVNERTGILVEPRDEEGLLAALETMLDKCTGYDREYIRGEAVRRFSYEAVGKEFLEIYNNQKFLEVQKLSIRDGFSKRFLVTEGKKMAKLLIIAYYYPPVKSGGTVRPLKMAKFLRDFGWEVTVLTHTYDWEEPPLDRNDGTIRIRDISNNKNRKGMRAVIWLLLRLYTEFLNRLGCYHSIYTWWKKRVIKNSQRIMEQVRPDVIIASYPPVETLEIGIYLAQTYHIPLICDFRDGILFEPIERPRMERYSCIKKRYEAIEKEAVNTAEAVITIADPITDYFKNHYRVNHVKAETIASGFDPVDFEDLPVPAVFDPSQFHIVFTGRFGLADGSNRVEFFFEALRIMIKKDEQLRNRLRVHLVGDFTHSDLEPIKDLLDIGVVINHGLVSRIESLGFQQLADLLLIITLPDRTCSVSTKIYEYLYTRKPILALTYGTVLAEMVEKTRAGWNVHPHRPEAIAELLRRIVSDREFYHSLQPDLEEINKYSFVFQIEKLDSIIKSFRGCRAPFSKGT